MIAERVARRVPAGPFGRRRDERHSAEHMHRLNEWLTGAVRKGIRRDEKVAAISGSSARPPFGGQFNG